MKSISWAIRWILVLVMPLSLWAQKPKFLNLAEWENQIELDSLLDENSGLQKIGDFIYTFNDSGGEAAVYKISTDSGKVIQKIKFKGTENIDFEDIAYDGKNLYIGDFGNNLGNRNMKFIYSFNLSKLKSNEKEIEVRPKVLKFVIDEEAQQKVDGPLQTNFDVEAFLYYDGKLHFFTKEWTDYKTTHYTLDTHLAFQGAKKIEKFNTKSVVTGADMENGVLVLTSYTKDGEVYLWKFDQFSEGKFFNGEAIQYFLGLSPAVGQIEGVTIKDGTIFISGEKFSKFGFTVPQKMYRVKLEELKELKEFEAEKF